ncbi:MAG: hypothetical protein RSB91_03360, partial [Clostridia bacterium]
ALQKSEAVLLPALQRRIMPESDFSIPFTQEKTEESPFRPMPMDGVPAPLALSTYVRPRGSMAGRSVLRAVGVMPCLSNAKPQYYAGRGRTMPAMNRWRYW